jgi:hypothetical protein
MECDFCIYDLRACCPNFSSARSLQAADFQHVPQSEKPAFFSIFLGEIASRDTMKSEVKRRGKTERVISQAGSTPEVKNDPDLQKTDAARAIKKSPIPTGKHTKARHQSD